MRKNDLPAGGPRLTQDSSANNKSPNQQQPGEKEQGTLVQGSAPDLIADGRSLPARKGKNLSRPLVTLLS
jgi:hypothetical protein